MPARRGRTTARPRAFARIARNGSASFCAVRVRPTNVIALLAMPAIPPAFAPFVGSLHWSLDLLACFPVQAMGALWLAAVCLFAAKRWRLAIPYALGGTAAAIAVVPGWCTAPSTAPSTAPTAAATAPAARVAAINLLRGAEAGVHDAIAQIREQDPDVVFFSELTPAWYDGLCELLPEWSHRCVRTDPGYYGVALFSRWPLRSAEVVPLGVDWAPAIRAVVETPSGPLGMLGVHTPRPGNGERAANLAKALDAIPTAIAKLPAARVVLGDFNSTPWNHDFRELLRTSGLVAASAAGHHPTWPAILPWPLRVPIDHVLCSSTIALHDTVVGAAFGSDHLPLFASVQIRGSENGAGR